MPDRDLALLVDAAREAGRIAMGFWKQAPEQWEKPDDAGPVTEADLAVNRALRERLMQARPGYGWLSEEDPDDHARLSREQVFVIDPIDGTRAFIAGEPSFAHSLAVTRAGKVVAAVVYLPALDRLYTATEAGSARLNGAEVRAGTANPVAEVLASRGALAPEHWRPDAAPELRRAFRPSIAWRLCLVAEGSFDAMLSFRPTWEWDIAAGSLIAERAGALTTEARGGALSFNSPQARTLGILAAPPTLHADLTARMSSAQS